MVSIGSIGAAIKKRASSLKKKSKSIFGEMFGQEEPAPQPTPSPPPPSIISQTVGAAASKPSAQAAPSVISQAVGSTPRPSGGGRPTPSIVRQAVGAAPQPVQERVSLVDQTLGITPKESKIDRPKARRTGIISPSFKGTVIAPYEEPTFREKLYRKLAGVTGFTGLPAGMTYEDLDISPSLAERLAIPTMAPIEKGGGTYFGYGDEGYGIYREPVRKRTKTEQIQEGVFGGIITIKTAPMNIPAFGAKIAGEVIAPPPAGLSELEWRKRQAGLMWQSTKEFVKARPAETVTMALVGGAAVSKAGYRKLTTPKKLTLVEGTAGGKVKTITGAKGSYGRIESLAGQYDIQYPLGRYNPFRAKLPKTAKITFGAGEFARVKGRTGGYATYDVSLPTKKGVSVLQYESEFLATSKPIDYKVRGVGQRWVGDIPFERILALEKGGFKYVGAVELAKGAADVRTLIQTRQVGIVSPKGKFSLVSRPPTTKLIPSIQQIETLDIYEPAGSVLGKQKYAYFDVQLESGFRAEGIQFGRIPQFKDFGKVAFKRPSAKPPAVFSQKGLTILQYDPFTISNKFMLDITKQTQIQQRAAAGASAAMQQLTISGFGVSEMVALHYPTATSMQQTRISQKQIAKSVSKSYAQMSFQTVFSKQQSRQQQRSMASAVVRSQRQITMEVVKQAQQQAIVPAVGQRVKQLQQQKQVQRFAYDVPAGFGLSFIPESPRPAPPVWLALPPLPAFRPSYPRPSRKGRGDLYYVPSLVSFELGITAPRMPKIITGVGIRPLIQPRRRRKRRK